MALTLGVSTACAPSEPPAEFLSAAISAGHRTVGEGSDISVWLTDEEAEITASTRTDCVGTDCVVAFSADLLLRGTYRDYSSHPVEGTCCDSSLDERTWESAVSADVRLHTGPDRLVLTLTDTSAFAITVRLVDERTTGAVEETSTTEGFDGYPGLLGRSGATIFLSEGCASDTGACWTTTDWQDADGAPLSDWPEGRIGGELSASWTDP